MEAKELRVGNLVYHNHGFGVKLPAEITEGRDIDMFEEFEGIPLNDEYLIKFGFKKQNNQRYFGNGLFMISWFEVYGEIDLDIEGQILTLKCEYIHQLQNIYFALSGAELKTN